MIVLADNKKAYERAWPEHIVSKSIIRLDGNMGAWYHDQTVRVPVEVFGTYIQFAKAMKKENRMAMRETTANAVSLSFSAWAHFHGKEVKEINLKLNGLYNGTKDEYKLYHKLIRDKEFIYGRDNGPGDEKVRMNIPLHEKQLYPAIVEHSNAAGVSISSFLTGIVAGGFLLWPGINNNAREDMLDNFKKLECWFQTRYKLIVQA